MRLDEYYTVRELLQLNEEKAQKNEFKPKFGNGAKRGNGDNEKAVKDILKNAESLNKGAEKQKDTRKNSPKNFDYNRTNLEWTYTTGPVNGEDVPQSYKDRVKKLATVGTESDMADYFDVEGNKRFYKERADVSDERLKAMGLDGESGLKGKEYKKAGFDFKPKGAMKESVPTKRLVFKNTTFLNEEQVLKRVPEDYKIDENRFYMRDKTGTDYLVECQADPFGYVHMQIINKINKQQINEELEKIKRLTAYSYGDDNVKVDKTKLEDMSESISNFRQLLK